MRRFPTGVTGLDTILGGGLFEGGMYFVDGRPGVGKTILVNQVCHAHAADGGRVVYVTLLAESHARLVSHLGMLRFFRPELVGTAVEYIGGYGALRDGGPRALLELLRSVLRERRPTILVLDGVASLALAAPGALALKEVALELQVLAALSGCTTILISSQTVGEPSPTHTIVDGIIELSRRGHALRAVREVEVVKLRGAAHLLGRHELEITDEGMRIHPRTEAVVAARRPMPAASEDRLITGVGALDAMLHGGVKRATTTLLLGFAGSGKTMLGLHFLAAGEAAGEPGLFFGFYESPPRLIAAAVGCGLPLDRLTRAGLTHFLWNTPLHDPVDLLAERLLDAVRRHAVRRLVIDGLEGFRASAIYPQRVLPFLTALTNELRARGVTTFITDETLAAVGPDIRVSTRGVSAVMENLIVLEYLDVGPDLKRLISVVKERGSSHDASMREMRIGPRGIEIDPTPASAEAILGRGAGAIGRVHGRGPREGR